MRYYNLNDEVYLRGEIIEVIERQDGTRYKIKFDSPTMLYGEVIVTEDAITEKAIVEE